MSLLMSSSMAGWFILFHPPHISRSMGRFRYPPGDPDNDWITGAKERPTVGPKLPGLPRDPDYRGTTVLVTDS
jgi:hypothetical protein